MSHAYGLKTPGSKKPEKEPSFEDIPNEALGIEERITNYLDTQGCVLWGQFFDIQSKEGRRQASGFILDLLIDLGITREMVE